MHNQKVYVVSSPSGCGKTTVIHAICKKFMHIKRAITSTTRHPRAGEVHGVDYFFLTKTAFQDGMQKKEFVERTERYGHFYGLSRSSIQDIHNSGHDVILNVDWQGMHSLREVYGDDLISFFLLPPSLQALKERLLGRNLDSSEVIQQRLDCAKSDAQHWHHYDHVLVNDHLPDTIQTMTDIIKGSSYTTDKTEIQKHVSCFEKENFN